MAVQLLSKQLLFPGLGRKHSNSGGAPERRLLICDSKCQQDNGSKVNQSTFFAGHQRGSRR